MESKRILEEVRREGVDVSVPSNTISKELAEKIRNKYFPKKEPAVQRAIRVVKKARPVEAEHAEAEPHAPAPEEAPVPEVPLYRRESATREGLHELIVHLLLEETPLIQELRGAAAKSRRMKQRPQVRDRRRETPAPRRRHNSQPRIHVHA